MQAWKVRKETTEWRWWIWKVSALCRSRKGENRWRNSVCVIEQGISYDDLEQIQQLQLSYQLGQLWQNTKVVEWYFIYDEIFHYGISLLEMAHTFKRDTWFTPQASYSRWKRCFLRAIRELLKRVLPSLALPMSSSAFALTIAELINIYFIYDNRQLCFLCTKYFASRCFWWYNVTDSVLADRTLILFTYNIYNITRLLPYLRHLKIISRFLFSVVFNSTKFWNWKNANFK